MKKSNNKIEQKNEKKQRKLDEFVYFPLYSALMAGVISVVFFCTCFSGEFKFVGMPVFVTWIALTCLFLIVFCCSRIFVQTTNKSITVLGMVCLITVGLSAILMRYTSFTLAIFTLSSLLIVLILSKKEAFISVFLNTIVFLALIYIYNTYALEIPDYTMLLPLAIKAIASILLIILYKPTFNRLKVIAISLLSGLFTLVLELFINIFAFKFGFIDAVMDAVWMFVAEVGVAILSLILSPIFEWVFRLETSMQFLEYISFDQPLLKELAEKAPGTFNHSIQVGNLAERCAYAIGENVNVAKAAAYFHDIGKMQSPEFFTENQTDNYNPHDDLIFETSVKIITRHTELGYETLLKHKFPRIICNVAHEHHGNSSLNYFYIKAQNITEGDVDSSDYCYPGPRPTTRISAIIMIADSVEAASRSMNMSDRNGLINLVDNIIKEKRESGQFDDCDITMKQLAIIRDTLVESLVGIAHTRISYPTRK